jgi:hypothetical protein
MTGRAPRSSSVLSPDARAQVAHLHAKAWGVAIGSLSAVALFTATIFLVLRGGPNMGQHLNLLGIFLPGYSVSVTGAFIGVVYAFVIGYALGRLVGFVYNRVAG